MNFWFHHYHNTNNERRVQLQRQEQKNDKTSIPNHDRQDTIIAATPNKIAYAISISSCNTTTTTLFDGAAVLQHSIRTKAAAASSSKYTNFDFVALVHPDAVECCRYDLETLLGFRLLVRDVPVEVTEIRGDYLRNNIEHNGCCGEKELLKLYSYTLTDYDLVVHLDLDVIVLQPLDSIFDLLLSSSSSPSSSWNDNHEKKNDLNTNIIINPNNNTIGLQWPLPTTTTTTSIDAAFTLDYAMVPPIRKYKPVQGGLLILKPSLAVFEALVSIVREGDFQQHKGWGGIRVGPFYGAMTIQGLLSYYYYYYRLNQNNNDNKTDTETGTMMNIVELNRCQYNNMADAPRLQTLRRGLQCVTGETNCEDCRERPLDQITSFHFTNCQKPWWCLSMNRNNATKRICRGMHHEWNRLRYELEQEWNVTSLYRKGNFESDHFYGHCRSRGQRGYIPLPKKKTRNETTTSLKASL